MRFKDKLTKIKILRENKSRRSNQKILRILYSSEQVLYLPAKSNLPIDDTNHGSLKYFKVRITLRRQLQTHKKIAEEF